MALPQRTQALPIALLTTALALAAVCVWQAIDFRNVMVHAGEKYDESRHEVQRLVNENQQLRTAAAACSRR